MRELKYLSPTSISTYLENPTKFYLNYLADNRPLREPQTPPMAVGSAFDAFVKSYLHKALFGASNDPRFDRVALFESQVESHNRDVASKAGEHCFDEYKLNGCLADLMLELQGSITDPRFELELSGQVDGFREGITLPVGPVMLLGKPDIYYTNKMAARVIHDWKVNGYYAKSSYPPAKGYIRLRCMGVNQGAHKEALMQNWKGIRINMASTLETNKEDWARQVAIYSWLCGEEVGTDECIASIDQLSCIPDSIRDRPKIRVAEHRSKVGRDYQFKLFAKCQEIWSLAHGDHYFQDMTKEESQERCRLLDDMSLNLSKPVESNDDWLKRMSLR